MIPTLSCDSLCRSFRMSEPTVTGKAAWDAIGEGRRLDLVRGSLSYELRNGRLWCIAPNGESIENSSFTVDSLLVREFRVLFRVGDALTWGEA